MRAGSARAGGSFLNFFRRMKLESEVFAERLGSAEAKEAFTAFFEKRKPNFGR